MNSDPQTGKSSNATFIILAIVGVVILVFAALIIAGAVGIFLYTSRATVSESSVRESDLTRPTATQSPEPPATASRTTTSGNKTEALIEAIKQKPTIGGFALQNVIPQQSNRAFNNSLGEVKGVYTANGKTVLFVVAEMEHRARATVEFGRMIGRERARGAKVTEQIRVKDGTINAAFENGNTKSVAFCNWPDKAPVLCHVVGSDDEKALIEFREGLASGR
ncbi:MAG: hypothetical protein IPM21_05690 [Acidobacteria bacterium]|nr:hypothetical protein [Acidobacteriota bacterium]